MTTLPILCNWGKINYIHVTEGSFSDTETKPKTGSTEMGNSQIFFVLLGDALQIRTSTEGPHHCSKVTK